MELHKQAGDLKYCESCFSPEGRYPFLAKAASELLKYKQAFKDSVEDYLQFLHN